MASGPGLLYVTAQPHDSLPAAQFHDWYNNEHGPVRLRLPFVINGFRYRARGDAKPSWLAIYDVANVAELTRAPYTTLREPKHKTQRETETMKQIALDRRIYDLRYTKSAREMRPDESGATIVISAVSVSKEHEAEVHRWAANEHIPALSKTPGWLRSRHFRTSVADDAHDPEHLIVHEFGAQNEVSAARFREATKDSDKDILSTSTRGPFFWELQYTFGPAPRELGALWDPSVAPFSSLDQKTKTFPVPAAQPAIESYVTTDDGAELRYRLEGNGDAEAPLIVLVNPILVNWGIWDGFVTAFLADPRHKHFRILRYNSRGRSSHAGSQSVSLDLLSQDLLTLLDAVRAHAHVSAIGVSLGGATVLNTALKHPDRVPRFVACDTNDVAPPSNPKAWDERVAIAEQEGARDDTREPIVGEQLAEKTVRRWFVEASYDGGTKEAEAQRVKAMVRTNSLHGFKSAVKALYSYNIQQAMKDAIADGLFVVGEGDGVLPRTMSSMAQRYGKTGTELAIIDNAGHLPMVEQPAKFAEVVGKFVCRT